MSLNVHARRRLLALSATSALGGVVQGPDRAFYVLTSNLGGRGVPPPDGDRVLRLSFVTP
jgi:hypothetical protein